MQRHGALPLYQQISELLIRDIAAGRLLEGERLPPERAMAADLGIAVGTLRAALRDLAAKGMVARVQGSGNYIRAGNDRASVYSMFRLERVGGGGLPTARVVSVDRVAKDPALPPFGTAPDGHRIRRLRYLSGDLAAVEEIWLDGSHAARIAPEDLSESLYLYYRERLNLWIARAEDSIGQAPLPDWTPPEFPHPAGTPMPHITRLARLRDGSCAEASWTWFNPDTARYVARLR